MFILIISIIFVFFILANLRINQVFNYRMKCIKAISALNLSDIRNYTGHRWNEYKTCTFDEMVLKFWKPLSSWYAEYDWNVK